MSLKLRISLSVLLVTLVSLALISVKLTPSKNSQLGTVRPIGSHSHKHRLAKPMGPVNVDIQVDNEDNRDQLMQKQVVRIKAQRAISSLILNFEIVNDLKILSHNLPSVVTDIRAGEELLYEVEVEIIGKEPHLAVSARSDLVGEDFGHIGHHVFYHANVDALPTQSLSNSLQLQKVGSQKRAPSHLKRGRGRLRLDPSRVKIQR